MLERLRLVRMTIVSSEIPAWSTSVAPTMVITIPAKEIHPLHASCDARRQATAGASALGAAFTAAAAALDQKIAIVQAHPLPSGDASGAVSFFVVMALIIGGYLSSTIAMAFGGRTTRRRRLASLAIAAVIGALLTDALAGPVLGTIPTSKFLVLWALFTLVMMAVAFATAALQTVFGAGGTLVVVIVFVIFGAPSSGGTVPAAYLSATAPLTTGLDGGAPRPRRGRGRRHRARYSRE